MQLHAYTDKRGKRKWRCISSLTPNNMVTIWAEDIFKHNFLNEKRLFSIAIWLNIVLG
jgi:hypothetical protein